MVLNELRKLCIQEKRRRSSFRRMVDYLVDRLDELDLLDREQTFADGAPEEKLAKHFGSEDKELYDSASSRTDNRPRGKDEVFVDDEDDDESRARKKAIRGFDRLPDEGEKQFPESNSSSSLSMASRAMGFVNE